MRDPVAEDLESPPTGQILRRGSLATGPQRLPKVTQTWFTCKVRLAQPVERIVSKAIPLVAHGAGRVYREKRITYRNTRALQGDFSNGFEIDPGSSQS